MAKIKDLKELFHHQLKDVYNAESQLVKALPKMQKKASNEDLRKAFSEHLEETKEHKKRLEKIGKTIGLDDLSGETCEAMQGLIEEANSFIKENSDSEVKDAGIIADAQRIEHYEISAYGTLAHYAKTLNEKDVANMLQQTLDEETAADKKLNDIAVNNVNVHAKES